ncbi:MAG: DUF4160 domain-containing protein [Anaerolineae bacterium]
MPTIFIEGYKFRFYSTDINEPPHVHVLRDDKVAKVWLRSVELQSYRGYNRTELNRILKLTRENQARFLEAWNEYFKY